MELLFRVWSGVGGALSIVDETEHRREVGSTVEESTTWDDFILDSSNVVLGRVGPGRRIGIRVSRNRRKVIGGQTDPVVFSPKGTHKCRRCGGSDKGGSTMDFTRRTEPRPSGNLSLKERRVETFVLKLRIGI